jgi:putative transposase
MPKMPYYKESGALMTVKLTNQVCKIKDGKLQFPTKKKLSIMQVDDSYTLKEVRIKPSLIGFTIDIVFEVKIKGEIIPESSHNNKLLTKYKEYTTLNERALAIDTGLSNLCAVVNNFNDDNFIIKGNYLKSVNHWYNKQLAHYQSIAKKENNCYWTSKLEQITKNRNNKIKDYMHKTTTYIAEYAKKNNISVVVVGHNKNQKQEINMGTVNNQNFVQIPILMLINQLQYKLNRYGVELVITEESYTSKASFENRDVLPTYGKDDNNATFSGTRIKRGLYQTYGRTPINADVNGAANILRKAFPNVRKWDIGVVATPIVVNVV